MCLFMLRDASGWCVCVFTKWLLLSLKKNMNIMKMEKMEIKWINNIWNEMSAQLYWYWYWNFIFTILHFNCLNLALKLFHLKYFSLIKSANDYILHSEKMNFNSKLQRFVKKKCVNCVISLFYRILTSKKYPFGLYFL